MNIINLKKKIKMNNLLWIGVLQVVQTINNMSTSDDYGFFLIIGSIIHDFLWTTFYNNTRLTQVKTIGLLWEQKHNTRVYQYWLLNTPSYKMLKVTSHRRVKRISILMVCRVVRNTTSPKTVYKTEMKCPKPPLPRSFWILWQNTVLADLFTCVCVFEVS